MSKNWQGLTPLGWKEWVAFPDWGLDYIKAKVDTGAQTSSLHVEDPVEFMRDGKRWVEFTVCPWQKNKMDALKVSAPVVDHRPVRSSSGQQENRLVILVKLDLAGEQFEAELTLTNRDKMGFRMLLGREALSHRFVVMAGKSHLGTKAPREIIGRNRMRRKNDKKHGRENL